VSIVEIGLSMFTGNPAAVRAASAIAACRPWVLPREEGWLPGFEPGETFPESFGGAAILGEAIGSGVPWKVSRVTKNGVTKNGAASFGRARRVVDEAKFAGQWIVRC